MYICVCVCVIFVIFPGVHIIIYNLYDMFLHFMSYKCTLYLQITNWL